MNLRILTLIALASTVTAHLDATSRKLRNRSGVDITLVLYTNDPVTDLRNVLSTHNLKSGKTVTIKSTKPLDAVGFENDQTSIVDVDTSQRRANVTIVADDQRQIDIKKGIS